MSRIRRAVAFAALLLASLPVGPARAVVLHAGDLVVSGGNAAGPFVARVDPTTGASQIISQGGLITNPGALAVAQNGFIYIAQQSNIIRVDPVTGAQSAFVTLATPSVRTVSVSNMISHTNGYLYYTSQTAEIVRLDPVLGNPTPITSGLAGIAVTEGPGGFLYVSNCLDTNADLSCDVLARKVDPVSGAFTQAGSGANGSIGKPRDIAFVRGDSMYVESANDRRLFRFNPLTTTAGAVPLVGNELSYSIQHMVGHPDNNLYLTHNYTEGRVDRIEPVSNTRSSMTIFPAPSSLVAIAVVRDWTVPARRSTWGQLKQIYR